MTNALQDLESTLQQRIGEVVLGVSPAVRALCIAVVARGHVLVQGVPGLGKTLLSKTLAGALGGSFKRVQGTSDLMPTDITGTHLFDGAKNTFVFRPGPLFADVVLFDEVNRAGPRTQSALLEAMEERQVSVDREMFALPADFLVIATQNPREFEGTYPLPESQLDRFMLRLDLSYPALEAETEVLLRYTGVAAEPSRPVSHPVPPGLVQEARTAAQRVHISAELCAYVLAVARASREHAQLSLGVSTRGALALMRAARILAGIEGAEFVTADDVKAVAPMVLPHRLMLTGDALLADVSESTVVARILEQVPAPR
ncbi:MAG TPA: MoxR family ATPase [Steroidobacteraceae bacterium]|jgi:MoxR-like ATPase|nr:MoxR family ATPase [Steroidobacteraceae bacterium]